MRSTSSSPQPGAAAAVRDVTALARLRAEARSRASDPYLLTVTSDGRPHCGTVTVSWDAPDSDLAVAPVPRTWIGSEAAGYRQVTLLWSAAEPGGYDLIADGTGTCRQAGRRRGPVRDSEPSGAAPAGHRRCGQRVRVRLRLRTAYRLSQRT
jgi:hypothetical protein